MCRVTSSSLAPTLDLHAIKVFKKLGALSAILPCWKFVNQLNWLYSIELRINENDLLLKLLTWENTKRLKKIAQKSLEYIFFGVPSRVNFPKLLKQYLIAEQTNLTRFIAKQFCKDLMMPEHELASFSRYLRMLPIEYIIHRNWFITNTSEKWWFQQKTTPNSRKKYEFTRFNIYLVSSSWWQIEILSNKRVRCLIPTFLKDRFSGAKNSFRAVNGVKSQKMTFWHLNPLFKLAFAQDNFVAVSWFRLITWH